MDNKKLFAIGTSNWDYYVVYYSNNPDKAYLRSVPKEGEAYRGCSETCFGDLNHVCRLIREGIWEGEFTELGKTLMVKEGHEKVLNEYLREKTFELTFFDTSRHYGTITRKEYVKCNSRSQAMSIGHEMRNRNTERDMIATYVA